ncbi:MAG: polygalacturonase [Dysgonamonadaceae bacterium]|jgi:polygalacturonase|nr:polygalacturonase [Dysgonamonadaceae bacterium]
MNFYIVKSGILLCLVAICNLTACSGNGNENADKQKLIGDGKTLNTTALQLAIDDCSAKGGGTVSLSPGEYLTGTIFLRKNVCLNLEKGATLSGSRNETDYPGTGRRKALIFAEYADNISITGEGVIDGNGDAFTQENNAPNRPTLVLLLDCNSVNVSGVTMKNSGFWTFRFVRCDGVDIRKVMVNGHANWNNDGFDIESRNVTISDCVLDTDDDAICFKSEDANYVVENCTVTDCKISSNCNFIKFGTASAGGFRNIKVSNCQLSKCSKSVFRFWEKSVPGVTNPVTGISGIALEVVDGGFMEDVTVSDIEMNDVQTPVFIRLGKRQTSNNSYLKDILIENIKANTVSLIASSITGVPGLRVQNVVVRNADLHLKGGGKAADTQVVVPEAEASYPENRMFGVMLPAYGFYLRHADNIVFDNVKLTIEGSDERYAYFADDVTGLQVINSSTKEEEIQIK